MGLCGFSSICPPPPKKKENDVDRQGLRKNPETMGYNPQKTEPCCPRLMFNRFGNRVDRANHGLSGHRWTRKLAGKWKFTSFSTIFKINLALTWTALTFQCSDNLNTYTQTLIFHTGKQYVKLFWVRFSKKQGTQLDLWAEISAISSSFLQRLYWLCWFWAPVSQFWGGLTTIRFGRPRLGSVKGWLGYGKGTAVSLL